jgi:hypothetical protein
MSSTLFNASVNGTKHFSTVAVHVTGAIPQSHSQDERMKPDLMMDAILLARQAGGRNTGATKLATVIHTAIALVQNGKFTVRHLP